MLNEVVTYTAMQPPPGWPCPNCGGLGNMCNGFVILGVDETIIRPASICPICEGSGRVEVRGIPVTRGIA